MNHPKLARLLVLVSLLWIVSNVILLVQPQTASSVIAALAPTATPQGKLRVPSTTYYAYLPLILCADCAAPPPAPAMTTSRYVVTTTLSQMDTAGCNQGQAGESGIVILDFGYPVHNTSTGEYGTHLLNSSNTYVSFDTIEWLVTEFLQGYYTCATTPGQHIVLALGVNNHPKYGGVTPDHGHIWGQVVDDIVNFINYPPSLSDKLSVAGAVDIEFSWNYTSTTRSWLDAYQPTNGNAIYNFGSCDSCPWYGGTNWVPANGWTYEDIFYVSYGAPFALALPEIYKVPGNGQTIGEHADQWQRVSKYGDTAQNYPVRFSGTMTQWYACHEYNNWPQCVSDGTYNTPEQGWTQLWQALSADPVTKQTLQWSTDIRWYTVAVR